ncbi:uncharacterized protein [Aegilops tauschii subsp. strangulata]|nr:uncharacterized protein LOC109752849 [Aegilops tauschii subsp. strangulata]
MAAMSSRTGHAPPAAPMATADLEAAIAALPVRKQRLRETFDRLVACAPPHYHLPFTWDDIDAHVSSLHASLSLRFRQMQQQPHPGAPVSATAIHDAEQPHPSVPVPATATLIGEQPDPCVLVSATPDEEMVREDEDASPVQEDDRVEDAGMGFVGAPWRQAGGTRDQEFPVPVRAHYARHAGSPMLRQPYTAYQQPDVLSQLNLPMFQRQQPYTPYHRQEFPAMAGAMNSYNIPPIVQQPYYNIPPIVQRPYVPYFRREFSPDFRQEFFPDDDVTRQPFRRQEFFPDDDVTRQPFRQEFFPEVTRQPPMGIDHVLQEQYMAMAHREPYVPRQQYMAHHQPHFPDAQAASAHGQGSSTTRRSPSRITYPDNINVGISEPSKKSRTIHKNTIYDYF